MRAVVDSSSLISLAWSGLLGVLSRSPLSLCILDVVREETVEQGIARGHPDASAIESAIVPFAVVRTAEAGNADRAVLEAAVEVGVLITNDVALGRRAANLGARWLRTADFVVLCVRTEKLTAQEGIAALDALRAAGRISESLLIDYRKEI